MNKSSFFIGFAVVVACLSLFLVTTSSQNFGATDANSALQQASLLTWEQSVATNFTNVRAPLAGMLTTTTASLSFTAITSSTQVGTTTSIGVALLAGDIVFVTPNTPEPGLNYVAGVNATSATNGTIQITEVYASSTAGSSVSPVATTFTVTVLPKASFLVPAAISF